MDIDLGQIVFVMYMMGAIAVGIYLIRDFQFGEDNVLIKKKGARLGPGHWGLYEGTGEEDPAMRQIEPPKPTKDIDGVAGGSGYAGGKAVKSGRV
jgi:hypothetical protein